MRQLSCICVSYSVLYYFTLQYIEPIYHIRLSHSRCKAKLRLSVTVEKCTILQTRTHTNTCTSICVVIMWRALFLDVFLSLFDIVDRACILFVFISLSRTHTHTPFLLDSFVFCWWFSLVCAFFSSSLLVCAQSNSISC